MWWTRDGLSAVDVIVVFRLGRPPITTTRTEGNTRPSLRQAEFLIGSTGGGGGRRGSIRTLSTATTLLSFSYALTRSQAQHLHHCYHHKCRVNSAHSTAPNVNILIQVSVKDSYGTINVKLQSCKIIDNVHTSSVIV